MAILRGIGKRDDLDQHLIGARNRQQPQGF